jgi:hypothetical protein
VVDEKVKMAFGFSKSHNLIVQSAEHERNVEGENGDMRSLYTGPECPKKDSRCCSEYEHEHL